MKRYDSRLKKLEQKRPEQPPMPEFNPENPTESLFRMIEHSHQFPVPRPDEWDDEKMGCSAKSYVEVVMQKNGEDE